MQGIRDQNHKNTHRYFKRSILFALFFICLAVPHWKVHAQESMGCVCTSEGGENKCGLPDCAGAEAEVIAKTTQLKGAWETVSFNQFTKLRDWFTKTDRQNFSGRLSSFPLDIFIPSLRNITQQLSSVAVYQVMTIGMMMDAKHQLETQRLFQVLQAEAHKDYQPSEDFCWFGTNVRSLASSEQAAQHNAAALNARQMERHLGTIGTAGAAGRNKDKASRWKQFTQRYCDPQDNGWRQGVENAGLSHEKICGAGAADNHQANIDIDYTRLIEEPRSLDVDFSNADLAEDERDVMALGNNLYGHDVLSRVVDPETSPDVYMALRSVAAKRSVAESSYNAIVGMKSSGATEEASTRQFLAAVLTELGLPDDEALDILGARPSYYAQLEVLAKKIYQNPDFYANLYDKPANVARKSVALKAIELMLDRAIYESELRQEIATSVLLSTRLQDNFETVNQNLPAGGG